MIRTDLGDQRLREELTVYQGAGSLVEARLLMLVRVALAKGIDLNSLRPLFASLPERIVYKSQTGGYEFKATKKAELLAYCDNPDNGSELANQFLQLEPAFIKTSAFLDHFLVDDFDFTVQLEAALNGLNGQRELPNRQDLEAMVLWLDEGRMSSLQAKLRTILAKLTEAQVNTAYSRVFDTLLHLLQAGMWRDFEDEVVAGDVKHWEDSLAYMRLSYRVDNMLAAPGFAGGFNDGEFDWAAMTRFMTELGDVEQQAWCARVGRLITVGRFAEARLLLQHDEGFFPAGLHNRLAECLLAKHVLSALVELLGNDELWLTGQENNALVALQRFAAERDFDISSLFQLISKSEFSDWPESMRFCEAYWARWHSVMERSGIGAESWQALFKLGNVFNYYAPEEKKAELAFCERNRVGESLIFCRNHLAAVACGFVLEGFDKACLIDAFEMIAARGASPERQELQAHYDAVWLRYYSYAIAKIRAEQSVELTADSY